MMSKEKIDRKEIERRGTSLEAVIAGLFSPQRLLDYVENFVLYYDDKQKIIAQNHQFTLILSTVTGARAIHVRGAA